MQKLRVIDHPILKRDLTILRKADTPYGLFRETIRAVSSVLAYEVFRTLELKEVEIDTPLERTLGHEIAEDVIVVPILRAGLGMIDGFVEFLPEARIGHLGMYRDEETLEPVEYYCKVPPELDKRLVIAVDPMLATGNSSVAAIDRLKEAGANDLRMLCLLAAPEGVARMKAAHPDVPIFAGALDEKLNERGYIVPGLGDAGDRMYGTT